MREVAAQLGRRLTDEAMTVSVAESCTAGGLAYTLTTASGSSAYFLGGIIAYDNRVKISLLDVSEDDLARFGAVSAEMAEAMAASCRRRFSTDLAVSVTGIAGPGGGTPEKPLGLVYIGLASRLGVSSRRFLFSGSREDVRSASIDAALRWLRETVDDLSPRT